MSSEKPKPHNSAVNKDELAAAIEYAELGYKVFPLRCLSKQPACKHGHKDATCDTDQIEAWWSDDPHYNIGLSTEGLLVIDIDGANNPWPIDPEKKLELSAAPYAETQSGGRHHIFRQPEGLSFRNSVRKLAKNVDVRANGGYVVVPPSSSDTGQYKWIQPLDVPAASLPLPPEWLLNELSEVSTGQSEPTVRGNSILEGERNNRLTSIAGQMCRQGSSAQEIESHLLSINESECRPPLDEAEVLKIVKSVGRYNEEYEATDLGNAERLVARSGNVIRYVATRNIWLIWDGTRWKRDETGEVHRLAQATAMSISDEVRNATDETRRTSLKKWAKTSQSRARLSAMVDLAATQELVSISHRVLDQHPLLLNCKNGVVDLETRRLLRHDPGYLITQSTGLEYPTDHAECPLWKRTLARIFNNDRELISFLQRLCGVMLSGEVREQILPIFHGDGANGKTVIVETIRHIMGDYCVKAPHGFGIARKNERHPTELADLCGSRLAIISETDEGQRIDEAQIKELTGGDTIRARRMRQDFWEFEPSHTCLMVTNHRPVVRGTDYGIWRRLLLVPFTVTIPEEEQDKELASKLESEYPAILQWMVEGYKMYKKEVGLNPPQSVLVATKEYKNDMDSFRRFIEEGCILEPQLETLGSALFDAYKSWCENNGESYLDNRYFGKRLKTLPDVTSRRSNGTYYKGIGLGREESNTAA
ncbi:phage/plasmid primase, P4 family [Aeoliella sp. ICT_H6.2]|uniref:Phage/plasmid primase, P4 family n=1 Tax=Aeoliella straminimaris TaxID=2954799 RepID=A0A9X2FHK5_9BACT|nr:phage/plasmid primase, P4 family [Aeoliella straminimaris]MCO6046176.1 phage/plasmid primase, P4 family [Aeoliella straminimaris]